MRLDTHVVAWLYAGDVGRLSETARRRIDESPLVISPMVELELTFLHEIGRLSVDGPAVIAALRRQIGLDVSDESFADVADRAHALSWTRDPFDRLIAADAVTADDSLLTKDRTIREYVQTAFW